MSIAENLAKVKSNLPEDVCLVAVSKTKPISDIQEAYNAGQRDFGENKVQELQIKAEALPQDIRWHMIGHLQSKKTKHLMGICELIHGVDSEKLLETINRRADLAGLKQNVLLQVHIAEEDSKFGFDEAELEQLLESNLDEKYPNVNIEGFMGMATFTDNQDQIRKEFDGLNQLYLKYKETYKLNTLSMGMSGDYQIAIEQGSNMVRVGSAIFGSR